MSDHAVSARKEHGLALLLATTYVAALLFSTQNLGYARDEGFYFQAASVYRAWFDLLFADPGEALLRVNVDRFWSINREHPSLMKVLFALSHHVFFEKLGWIAEPGTAYRLPGMLMGGLGVGVVYLWASRSLGRAAGIVAAGSLAWMPRGFYHAHLACFDVPVATMWLLTAYAYVRSLETSKSSWVLATGICYGLLLETKHNAWLLPFGLVAHFGLLRGRALIAGLARGRLLLPRAWFSMLLLGPLVFWALWPWLWFDPVQRFTEYVEFHLRHDYYNMEFLGQTYWKPPMPRGYAWLMTLATVPLVTLTAGAIGVCSALTSVATRFREKTLGNTSERTLSDRASVELLWVLLVLLAYAPWWSTETPIFGGTKHWMPAYPFLALLAARGFAVVQEAALRCVGERGLWTTRAVPPMLVASVVAGPMLMTLHSHPFGLSFYTPLVGGAPTAATLGLNRTFWGYTTGSLTSAVNELASKSARVYVHDTALQSFEMFKADGRLRQDLIGTLSISSSDLALYHHEPHMSRVEYQIWVDYGTLVPSRIVTYDGVPITWLYERP